MNVHQNVEYPLNMRITSELPWKYPFIKHGSYPYKGITPQDMNQHGNNILEDSLKLNH